MFTKYKKNNFLFILAILLVILINGSFLFKGYVEKEYKNLTLSNMEFLSNNDKLKDFENVDGVLYSLSNDPWIVYDKKDEIDLNKIRNIRINVDYLSEENLESELYVKSDTYNVIHYTLKEGINNIDIPSEFYKGKKVEEIRFDLVTKQGVSIKIESIEFNEAESVFNTFSKAYNNLVIKFIFYILISIIPLMLVILGRKRIIMNKKGYAFLAIVSCIVLVGNSKNMFINNIVMSIMILFLMIGLYYFFTKFFIHIGKYIKFKINLEFILLSMMILAFYTIYNDILLIYWGIVFYPFYLLGFFSENISIKNYKNSKKIIIISIVFFVALLLSVMSIENISTIYTGYKSSEIKIKMILITSLLWMSIFCFISIEKVWNILIKIRVLELVKQYIILYIGMMSIINNNAINTINLIVLLIFIYILKEKNVEFLVKSNENDKHNHNLIYINKYVYTVVIDMFIIVGTILFFEAFIYHSLNNASIREIVKFILQYIESAKFLYNLVLVNIIYYLVVFILGKKLGRLSLFILSCVLIIGNFIKIKYHNTLLKPIDFLQIKEMILISKSFINSYILIFLVLIFLVLFICIFKFRRGFLRLVKPSPNIIMVIPVIVGLIILSGQLNNDKLSDINIISSDDWRGDEVRIERQGFFIYNYYNLISINEIKVNKPENYSEQTMNELKDECLLLNSDSGKEDIKPNVILVMQESMFDLEKINQIKISQDIEKNIKENYKATTISPRYGGGTASVEFEALTGFTNAFFIDNICQYTTYWNDNDSEIPSIAREFHNNGYITTAIHPNGENFYNRKNIYSAMGFDNFLSIADFSKDSQTNKRGYILDTEVNSIISQQLDSTEEPQFIFTVTIENHGAYNSDKIRNDISVSSSELSNIQINEAEVYAEGLYDADNFIASIIETVENTDRPTIVYVWGDHLPALSFLDKLGFLRDKYNKYSTPLVAYSNYKEINVDSEYISPNQIATQVLRDSGIEYNSYFDYIYSLRDKYPIVHKEFDIDTNDELIKNYELIQFDLLFGEKYIINPSN